jgi:hypothetical protein
MEAGYHPAMSETEASPTPSDADAAQLQDLDAEQRRQLEAKGYVQAAGDVVWIEPGGAVRREKATKLYYIATRRGVFRVSRISREVIEV